MATTSATIFSIQKFSTEDGPGIRTTVFFKGCPMRCSWCHNPEALLAQPELVWHSARCMGQGECINVCPAKALRPGPEGIIIERESCDACARCVDICPTSALEVLGRTMTVNEIFDAVMRDASFYDTSEGGVTLSGGEPLAQPNAALELLEKLDEAGIHTALDTCGGGSAQAFAAALPLFDLLLLDIKSVDPEIHMKLTGVPFSRIEHVARLAAESRIRTWVRSPIIPGCTDDESAVRAVARFVAKTLPHCERHDLLAFSNLCATKYHQLDRPFALKDAHLMQEETMEGLCAAAIEEGSTTAQWSGPTRIEDGADV